MPRVAKKKINLECYAFILCSQKKKDPHPIICKTKLRINKQLVGPV